MGYVLALFVHPKLSRRSFMTELDMFTPPTILHYSFFFLYRSNFIFHRSVASEFTIILLLFIAIKITIITHAIIIIIIIIIITALNITDGNTTECIKSVAKRVTIKTRQERKQRFDV